MRVFGFVLASIVGVAFWGLTIAFSGGVAPLGKTGSAEGGLFFIPILVFVAPLALIAFIRGHALTGMWFIAVAPVFGFLNFVLAMSAVMADANPWFARLGGPSGLLVLWVLLLVVAVGFLSLQGRNKEQPGDGNR